MARWGGRTGPTRDTLADFPLPLAAESRGFLCLFVQGRDTHQNHKRGAAVTVEALLTVPKADAASIAHFVLLECTVAGKKKPQCTFRSQPGPAFNTRTCSLPPNAHVNAFGECVVEVVSNKFVFQRPIEFKMPNGDVRSNVCKINAKEELSAVGRLSPKPTKVLVATACRVHFH